MSNFLEDFMGNLGGDVAKKMAANLDIDPNTISAMIPQVAPLILGGLKRQKDNFGGEQRIDHILNKYGSASVLDNLGDLFSAKAGDSSADPRLGGLLGDSGVQAANMLSNQFNLKTDTANQFITMLAPVAGQAKARPQALAWNIGTTGSTTSFAPMPIASFCMVI